MLKHTIFIIAITISFFSAKSQNSLSVQLTSLTAHPFAEQNLLLHQNKIDKKAYLTFEPALILSYDKYLINKLSFSLSTSVMKDRFNTLAGHSQIMLKYKVLKYYKHSLYLGFGPSVFYETNKLNVPNYVNEEKFNISNNTMYKIAWLSGIIEYNYYVSKDMDFILTLNHVHTRSLGLSLGISFELPNPDGKGCDCPSYR